MLKKKKKPKMLDFLFHLIILYHISFEGLVILHVIFLINIFQLRLNFLLLKLSLSLSLSIYIYTLH